MKTAPAYAGWYNSLATSCMQYKNQPGRWSEQKRECHGGRNVSLDINLTIVKGVGDGHPAELWPDCSVRIIVVVDGVLASL